MKAVFIRLDKIGDLICTLPMDQVEYMKDWEITWVISKGLGFVPDHAEPQRNYIELDKNNPQEAKAQLDQLLKKLNPDLAISIQSPWWVNFLLWKSRVPRRIGVKSKWDSFIFLNEGLRQKRSQAIKHEADYNLDLVKVIAPDKVKEHHAPVLKLHAAPQPALFELHHLQPKNYYVVHPGMAGSALNWPVQNYIALIEKIKSLHKVVLTGTPADEVWLKEIREHFHDDSQVINLQSKLSPAQLFYILEQAKAVIAPSTGVLHMAASLGTPVFGFYSPIRVQAPLRWTARGPNVHIFCPDVPDMSLITADQVFTEIQRLG